MFHISEGSAKDSMISLQMNKEAAVVREVRLASSQLVPNHCLEATALVFHHGICLGTDWQHSHFLAQLLDKHLVHGREAVWANEVQTGVKQQVIPTLLQGVAICKNSLQCTGHLGLAVAWLACRLAM